MNKFTKAVCIFDLVVIVANLIRGITMAVSGDEIQGFLSTLLAVGLSIMLMLLLINEKIK